MDIVLPNGMAVSFSSSQYPDQVYPPATSLFFYYTTCLVGKFTVTYTALPTPPENEVEGQSPLYYSGDNFYYDGVIYVVNYVDNVDVSLSLPAEGFTNAELIAQYLSEGKLSVITASDINSKYTATAVMFHWCNVLKCLKDKLSKLNCLIVKEPMRNDICEMELYEQVLQLNYLYSFTILVTERLTPDYLYQAEVISNYVNSICCCKTKNGCCK
jgi:hypothetical protein